MKTHYIICLDRSSSMGHLRVATVQAFNDRVTAIKNLARKHRHAMTVSLITFASDVRVHIDQETLGSLQPFKVEEYRPYGSTALFDAVGKAISLIGDLGPKDAVLIETITDGEENQSHKFTANALMSLVKRCSLDGNYTFAFLVPSGHYKNQLAAKFGVPLDNIKEWEQTEAGTREATICTQSALDSYMTARKAGKRSVDTFYVQTDLSQVKTRDVKAALDDISDRFKVYTVGSETPIKDFVEAKTRRDYVIGSTFYQLMKPERVQASKAVLIMEKGKAAIWGGQEARDLIGLPLGADAKVEPFNHGAYEIFVQSTSVNRKLPRGTKILVDVKMRKGVQPTWNHTTLVGSSR